MDFTNKIINGYTIMKMLASTNNSTTYLARCSHGNVCLKFIKNTDNSEMIQNECTFLRLIRHPQIIQIIDTFDWEGYRIIITPFANGGDLLEFIRNNSPIDEVTAAQIMYSAFTAIAHLHSMGIFHRDIKPEHFLLADDVSIKLVLSGFHFAKYFSPEEKESTEFLGTPYYCAPEILQHKPYDQSVDIWALGVTMYMVLSGESPFPISNSPARVEILNAQYSFDSAVWDNVSEEAKDLIQQMFLVNPEDRITAQQALQHPWFKKYIGPSYLDFMQGHPIVPEAMRMGLENSDDIHFDT